MVRQVQIGWKAKKRRGDGTSKLVKIVDEVSGSHDVTTIVGAECSSRSGELMTPARTKQGRRDSSSDNQRLATIVEKNAGIREPKSNGGIRELKSKVKTRSDDRVGLVMPLMQTKHRRRTNSSGIPTVGTDLEEINGDRMSTPTT